MRVLRVDRPGAVVLAECPSAEPRADEVVVFPRAVGLCGTDLELIDGGLDPAYASYPLVLGHEWSGVLSDGTPVVGEGIIPCGGCRSCRRGATNLCETYDEVGFTRPGAAADEVLVPSSLLHPLAPEVDLAAAALTEPMAVVLRGLRRVAPVPGLRALVIGDGTIGLLAAHLLRLWSPVEVCVLGLRPDQADLVTAAGASRFALTPKEAGTDFDVVVEAAGAPAAVETALATARRGGTVLLLGVAGHGRTAALRIDDLVNADLTVLGSFSYTSSAWRETVSLLNSGQVEPGFLITHSFPLSQADRALSMLKDSTGPRGKVLLTLP
ncbi:zinc-dependent alcohol dehydrogenase [Streptomyces rugosispiralis]|uniref:2-deoxy-scyllo-inosamine dehydrogenase n=1 Tax=Streptomyces rugosispiralis TaxID=2967341 RepID=A0ABT1URU0_9ACTN|nr:alcohol dehydrogenase catalytic domain-containing protein [Streptomyces rugosispiralis]MCQ8187838.1 alcohol dehydrogenase catalytic domain-containing protein [Streptomyces rugosispiralis]